MCLILVFSITLQCHHDWSQETWVCIPVSPTTYQLCDLKQVREPSLLLHLSNGGKDWMEILLKKYLVESLVYNKCSGNSSNYVILLALRFTLLNSPLVFFIYFKDYFVSKPSLWNSLRLITFLPLRINKRQSGM